MTMRFLTGLSNGTWWPVMAANTRAPSYWLNWRFLLCAIWVLVAMVLAALIIWRYEGRNRSRNRANGDRREGARRLYKGESWATCSKSINPIWLLFYRIVALFALLALILADTIVHSVGVFYFYTQWTFALVTIYFGVGSSLSINGCLCNCCKVESERDHCVGTDAEQGSCVPPAPGENTDISDFDDPNCRDASFWEYAFQIIFQTCAGAVALTDSVFWLIIYPFLTAKDYRLSFLVVCMHSVNAVFLVGDVILNSLRFPFFRIAYFVLWTCIFVIFQWIIHACVSMSWPYPFLDLSSPYAPIWYLSVGLLHFPCFAIFTLIFKIKRQRLSR